MTWAPLCLILQKKKLGLPWTSHSTFATPRALDDNGDGGKNGVVFDASRTLMLGPHCASVPLPPFSPLLFTEPGDDEGTFFISTP